MIVTLLPFQARDAIYLSVSTSTLLTELFMQLLGAYWMGVATRWGSRQKFYNLSRLSDPKVSRGRDAMTMYIGSVLWMSVFVVAISTCAYSIVSINDHVRRAVHSMKWLRWKIRRRLGTLRRWQENTPKRTLKLWQEAPPEVASILERCADWVALGDKPPAELLNENNWDGHQKSDEEPTVRGTTSQKDSQLIAQLKQLSETSNCLGQLRWHWNIIYQYDKWARRGVRVAERGKEQFRTRQRKGDRVTDTEIVQAQTRLDKATQIFEDSPNAAIRLFKVIAASTKEQHAKCIDLRKQADRCVDIANRHVTAVSEILKGLMRLLQNRLVLRKALAVEENTEISWGAASHSTRRFLNWYGKAGELRRIVRWHVLHSARSPGDVDSVEQALLASAGENDTVTVEGLTRICDRAQKRWDNLVEVQSAATTTEVQWEEISAMAGELLGLWEKQALQRKREKEYAEKGGLLRDIAIKTVFGMLGCWIAQWIWWVGYVRVSGAE